MNKEHWQKLIDADIIAIYLHSEPRNFTIHIGGMDMSAENYATLIHAIKMSARSNYIFEEPKPYKHLKYLTKIEIIEVLNLAAQELLKDPSYDLKEEENG